MSSLDGDIIECVTPTTSADECKLIKKENYLNNDTEQNIVNDVKSVEKSALENSTAAQSVKLDDEFQKVVENVELTVEEEDEDGFGGFVGASFTSVAQNHVESSEADNFSGCTTSQVDADEWVDFSSAPFPAQPVAVQDCCLNFMSLTKQMQSVLSCAFPSNFDKSDNVDSSKKLFRLAQVLDDDLKEHDENGSHFCITSRNLWHSLRTIEDANALNYRWANSLLYNVYLSALGMNVTLAQSAKSNLPLFATQLTSSSLIPEKLTSTAAASSLTFPCQNKVPVSSETVDFANSSQNGVDQMNLSSAPFNITAVDLDIFLRDKEPDKGGKAPWEEDLELLGLADVNLKESNDMQKSADQNFDSNFKFGNGNTTGLSNELESNNASSVSSFQLSAVTDVKK
ncbi:hypothetical protein T4B_1788 [Trichinella pseudospiralis]|uniref:Aftiphilin clathrin-binding box domain-containing protein n=1 Tax=Trichinella pseudospiralis TaxID=6337 RepID=A0A0V1E1G8_TRIPS|nr:hypothetical protein T4A_6857 [Trichinella pseudospiralis]KRZ23234.1 hypothetical protein T4B_1788 [Trichinella pseudospiralis]KRZ29333.1 hypothetical protein T4C_11292 [Trichinella pseudospiralis]